MASPGPRPAGSGCSARTRPTRGPRAHRLSPGRTAAGRPADDRADAGVLGAAAGPDGHRPPGRSRPAVRHRPLAQGARTVHRQPPQGRPGRRVHGQAGAADPGRTDQRARPVDAAGVPHRRRGGPGQRTERTALLAHPLRGRARGRPGRGAPGRQARRLRPTKELRRRAAQRFHIAFAEGEEVRSPVSRPWTGLGRGAPLPRRPGGLAGVGRLARRAAGVPGGPPDHHAHRARTGPGGGVPGVLPERRPRRPGHRGRGARRPVRQGVSGGS